MTAVVLAGVSKRYAHYDHPLDRLWEALTGRQRHRERVALHPLELTITEGQVVGLIGLNGAGKSTLLKLVAGTLAPSTGQITVNGRVSALLELGTGFHPDMSGRDNVYLSGAVKGLSPAVIDRLYDDIVAFSGLAEVMAEPVKTYSSGMLMRLAFAVATCAEPGILIIDEALSVGDAMFARKSFDRIMSFRNAGKTILFCSHSLYQVEAICSRVIWLHQGRIMADGEPAAVIAAYNEFLGTPGGSPPVAVADQAAIGAAEPAGAERLPAAAATTRLLAAQVSADGVTGRTLAVTSGVTGIRVAVRFASDPDLPCPGVGIVFRAADGRAVASAGSLQDGVEIVRTADGVGQVSVQFPGFPLLKGNYSVTVFLLSEDGIHVYDRAVMAAELKVRQRGLEQGIVSLPRLWSALEPPQASHGPRLAAL